MLYGVAMVSARILRLIKERLLHTAVQSRKGVTAYLSDKQVLYALQSSIISAAKISVVDYKRCIMKESGCSQ